MPSTGYKNRSSARVSWCVTMKLRAVVVDGIDQMLAVRLHVSDEAAAELAAYEATAELPTNELALCGDVLTANRPADIGPRTHARKACPACPETPSSGRRSLGLPRGYLAVPGSEGLRTAISETLTSHASPQHFPLL
jgi:hypothetical protein